MEKSGEWSLENLGREEEKEEQMEEKEEWRNSNTKPRIRLTHPPHGHREEKDRLVERQIHQDWSWLENITGRGGYDAT